ncbi:hypothetical protein [Streptomyces sp. NPDC047046]|uniref:hypothetical protein n=1 Tax=Streptomyces sp. NPDC047046 TaxID=3155378 RepID=UPI0033DBEC02
MFTLPAILDVASLTGVSWVVSVAWLTPRLVNACVFLLVSVVAVLARGEARRRSAFRVLTHLWGRGGQS